MAAEIVPAFKTSEDARTKNREAVRRYQKTPQGKAANARAMLKRYKELRSKGLCPLCKNPARKKMVYCQPCADRIKIASDKAKRRNVENGICPNCGKNPVLPSMKGKNWSFCERCYFKKTSVDCLKTAKHAELIGQKLRHQNRRCAYTDEEIILGLNDSLDHILPISRFPELARDPTNVEWVTRKVNCMKWDSTRDEFIATAYAVVKHFESVDPKSDSA